MIKIIININDNHYQNNVTKVIINFSKYNKSKILFFLWLTILIIQNTNDNNNSIIKKTIHNNNNNNNRNNDIIINSDTKINSRGKSQDTLFIFIYFVLKIFCLYFPC